MSRADAHPKLDPQDALALISTAATRERLGPLGDLALLLVDFSHLSQRLFTDPAALENAKQALAQTPCPCIAITPQSAGDGENDSDLTHAFAAAFDVCIDAAESTSALCDAVHRNPHASLALVQLTRLGVGRSLHEGLVAESLAYSMLQSGPEFARWLAARGEPKTRPQAREIEPAVQLERRGDTLELCLNRPAKRNAFSTEIRDELHEALCLASADESIRRVVLSGRGSAFSSGGDLDEFGSFPDPATAHAVRSTRNVGRVLADLFERVEVHVHGACIGAGVELPAFAKRVIASEDATFELPEVSMGLVPGAGGTASLPRRIGRSLTNRLALGGERIDARTALAWGLIDEIAR